MQLLTGLMMQVETELRRWLVDLKSAEKPESLLRTGSKVSNGSKVSSESQSPTRFGKVLTVVCYPNDGGISSKCTSAIVVSTLGQVLLIHLICIVMREVGERFWCSVREGAEWMQC